MAGEFRVYRNGLGIEGERFGGAWRSVVWKRKRGGRIRRRGVADGDRSDEPVAALGEGFDEAGIVGFVGESVAEFVDGGVEAVLEVDEGVFGPEAFLELLAGDELARVLEEDG